jgi:hypothetical protein
MIGTGYRIQGTRDRGQATSEGGFLVSFAFFLSSLLIPYLLSLFPFLPQPNFTSPDYGLKFK